MEIIKTYEINGYLFKSENNAKRYANKYDFDYNDITVDEYFITDEGWKTQDIRNGNLRNCRKPIFEDE